MYEAYTYEFLLDRALKNAKKNNPSIDTREGSIIYNAVAPTCLELANVYVQLDLILNESFADTATRTNLIKRCAERGIVPEPSTKAIRRAIIDSAKSIPIGTRFSLNVLNYTVIKYDGGNNYQLECETEGIIGNMESGKLIPIDYVDGVKSAELTEILIAGEDEEDTEILRQRYFNSLNAKAFGGNMTDYKEKTKAINGVGGVKVYPAWNGGGTVKLVIIDTENKVPSQILIDSIQEQIDPTVNQGKGQGIAPIGHTVTVEGITEEFIDIQTKITFNENEGWNWENSQIYIDECIDNYFKELGTQWENESNILIRISQIESQLLLKCSTQIFDIADTRLNGKSENYLVHENSIPKRNSIIELVNQGE